MIHLDITKIPGLKKELEEEANELGLSLNAYIRMLLIERHKKND